MPLEETKRALIVVRTYPVPAKTGVEVSCTAAITDKGEWLRLFPVPWRYLPTDQRFRKYEWVELKLTKASDSRPESYRLRQDGPKKIERLIITPESPNWTDGQIQILSQGHLFDGKPKQTLEKIPHKFQYKFWCDDSGCNSHTMICTDWEMGEAWRRWSVEYGDKWEHYYRQRFEKEMMQKYDTHFYVGTVHQHPGTWIIVGLFYPPHVPMESLFTPTPTPYQ